MNDLTPTRNSTLARPISPELSPELTALLDDSGNPERAVSLIAGSADLLAEAKAALPALKALTEAKAGREGVKAVIGRRLAIYPQPQRTQAEWDAWWADYFDVLADVTLASLEAGMRAYVAMPDSEFMPKPGKLRELAFTAPCRSLMRYYRATMAIGRAEAMVAMADGSAAESKRADPAEIKKLFAEFKARQPPPETAKPLPYIGGIPDERGITPQMRELLARRAAE